MNDFSEPSDNSRLTLRLRYRELIAPYCNSAVRAWGRSERLASFLDNPGTSRTAFLSRVFKAQSAWVILIFIFMSSGCSLMVGGSSDEDINEEEFREFYIPKFQQGERTSPDASVVDSGFTDALVDSSVTDAGIADAAIDSSIDATPMDAAIDANVDASPPVDASPDCDLWTDDGCTDQQCKNAANPECVNSTGEVAEFGGCSDDSDCATGMGCWGLASICTTYCDGTNLCSASYLSCDQGLCAPF